MVVDTSDMKAFRLLEDSIFSYQTYFLDGGSGSSRDLRVSFLTNMCLSLLKIMIQQKTHGKGRTENHASRACCPAICSSPNWTRNIEVFVNHTWSLVTPVLYALDSSHINRAIPPLKLGLICGYVKKDISQTTRFTLSKRSHRLVWASWHSQQIVNAAKSVRASLYNPSNFARHTGSRHAWETFSWLQLSRGRWSLIALLNLLIARLAHSFYCTR